MSKIVAIVGGTAAVRRIETEPDTPPEKVAPSRNDRKRDRKSKPKATARGSSAGIGYGRRGPKAKKKIGRRGPRTSKGKAASAMNALRHGVYSRVEILPFEDPKEYQAHLKSFLDEYGPVGPTEIDLVREIAQITWRRRWIKAAYIAKVYWGLKIAANEFENGHVEWPGADEIDFLETLVSSHETLESELDEIVHDHQSATNVLREGIRLGLNADLDAILKPASAHLKNDWEKHLKRSKCEVKAEELPDELAGFIVSNFIPRVLARLDNFKNKKDFRSFVAGEALTPEDTMSFERAENHLDRRLKTQLNMLFGMQDRRTKDD